VWSAIVSKGQVPEEREQMIRDDDDDDDDDDDPIRGCIQKFPDWLP
jgi:hypothetical protein